MTDPTPFLGIPYDRADCVTLTMSYLGHSGIAASDPRTHPEEWVPCSRDDAVIITYRDRTHVAPVVGPYIIETRKRSTSHLLRVDRLRNLGVEYWRPRT